MQEKKTLRPFKTNAARLAASLLSGTDRLAICLDYDGTLVPIVSTPGTARPSPRLLRLLRSLSQKRNIRVCLVTGRSLRDIRTLLPLPGLDFIANHGLEILSKNRLWTHPAGRRVKSTLKSIRTAFRKEIAGIPGTALEDKTFVLTLHYRNAPQGASRRLERIVRSTITATNLRMRKGKKSLEIGMTERWGKGRAILFWAGSFLPAGPKTFFFAGDDRTDEDAFRSLKDLGVTVFVGEKKNSAATYRARSHAEILDFLETLAAGS